MNTIEELIEQLCPQNSNRGIDRVIPHDGWNDSAVNSVIPPFSRNDGQSCGGVGGNSGGFAARISTPSLLSDAVISSEARNLISKIVRHSDQSEETNTMKGDGND